MAMPNLKRMSISVIPGATCVALGLIKASIFGSVFSPIEGFEFGVVFDPTEAQSHLSLAGWN